MNTGRMNVAGGVPSRSKYVSDKQPYYICAPEYGSNKTYTRVLHRLCNALNVLGFEAYLETRETCGSLWTPVLTEATKVAHYRAGKKPVVVSAEKISSSLGNVGVQVKFHLEKPPTGALRDEDVELVYSNAMKRSSEQKTLFIPVLDVAASQEYKPLELRERSGVAFFHSQYSAAGGAVRDFGVDAVDLSAADFDSEARAVEVLRNSKVLFSYEYSELLDVARLCGCPVVLLPNAVCLKNLPAHVFGAGKKGVAWGEASEEIAWADSTVLEWRKEYLQGAHAWEEGLIAFVQETQLKAGEALFEKAWPQSSVDLLDIKSLTLSQQGERADRKKYQRVNEQYERWSKYCTIREIDADIYAEHLATGTLPAISVLVDQRGYSLNSLADTLDSLAECLWRPALVVIVSNQAAPESFDMPSDLLWLCVENTGKNALEGVLELVTDCSLLIQSGTQLAPQALVEWSLATRACPDAELIYSDEDLLQPSGAPQYPFFKPDANIELLRCTNYLGNALLVQSAAWASAGYPLFDGGLYAYALALCEKSGRSAIGHIDSVLVHSNGAFKDGLEELEYAACNQELSKHGLAKGVRPLERLGTWLVDYMAPSAKCVSLVVSTGMQTGYMRSLVESLHRYPQESLAEIILVCSPEHVYEVEYSLANVPVDVPLKIIELAQENYSHSAALNAGVAQAICEFVLVCDDDTEVIHTHWLAPLLGIAQQSDVGCVAPRLLSNRGADARVSGGPLVLGINGTAAPYNGETGRLEECGVHSRLQLTQDVGAVAGHFFLFRKANWSALQGFDVARFGLWFSVLDFCLRLNQIGKRHVWTPLTSVLHQGGKTIESLARDTRTRLKMADSELSERNSLLGQWAEQLAKDASYNRHLSLSLPYDIENTIVVDWQPKRKDRPRVLACPLTSGAGQYRVVEPLNALQDAGLAQTCVIVPIQRGSTRILQPLELVRAAPDRLILQHSVDDAQLGMIAQYRRVMPHLTIIQMVDDLLGDVPAKHPNRVFQSREGHQRMARALKQSDRLIVTTDTLKQHYQKYVNDVRLLPNSLDKQWASLRNLRTCNRKLRIGWVGAGQHKGDLELVTNVVKELASEVDWIFMGMCTDEIRPHIKEYHDFVAISDYPGKMFTLDLDIAIAPLEKNFFNECKSNLRLLEYGAMAWPVVCSDVFPYQSMNPPVVRCANSAKDWVDGLRKLMDDQALRFRMGDELHAWVQSNFLLKNKTKEWMQAIFD